MGKVESIIKSEVLRLAKKEVRMVFRPLAREVRALRLKLSGLSKSVNFLDRRAKEEIRQDERKKMVLEASPDEVKSSRFSPGRIRALRLKLALSQKQLAALTGVSLGAVGSWEKGKFEPRGDKKAALIALRKLGRRNIQKLLQARPAEKPAKRKVRPAAARTRKAAGGRRLRRKRAARNP